MRIRNTARGGRMVSRYLHDYTYSTNTVGVKKWTPPTQYGHKGFEANMTMSGATTSGTPTHIVEPSIATKTQSLNKHAVTEFTARTTNIEIDYNSAFNTPSFSIAFWFKINEDRAQYIMQQSEYNAKDGQYYLPTAMTDHIFDFITRVAALHYLQVQEYQ